jgi:hypothetical protein
MTHLSHETNTLYRNDGRGRFEDDTARSGLGAPSRGWTGFGTAWLDWDNDGRLDLLVANGAVEKVEALVAAGDPHPLGERNQLFRQNDAATFEDVTAEAGPAFEPAEVSRGAAFGDVDDDGDVDVLITNNAGPARLLRNEVGHSRPWVGFVVVDEAGRDALGARVELVRDGAPSLWRRVRVAASYLSSNDPRVLFGTGDSPAPAVRVHWPDGAVEEWPEPRPGAYSRLRRGEGTRDRGGSTGEERER